MLCVEAARALRDDVEGIHAVAASLELIHTYSLIHDDLPALDNDDLRRGRPTCHKMFGEAMAILAGDALLTLAFEVLGGTATLRLVQELAAASGTVGGDDRRAGVRPRRRAPGAHRGVARADSPGEDRRAAAGERAARRAAWAGAGEDELDALSRYGEHAGLAFQIVDDVLDVEQSSPRNWARRPARMRSSTRSPSRRCTGSEASKPMAEEERALAHEALAEFGERAQRLRELADLIVERQN
jgi:geranylgeranyl diphosphate synthase, type II